MNDQSPELRRTDEYSQAEPKPDSQIERKFDRDRAALIPIGHSPGSHYLVEFRNVGDVMEYAKTMALDPTMPAHLRNRPATCLHVIHDARGWQMDEFKVALMSFVVNGSLCYMAQMSVAVINKWAPIKGRVKYSHSGDGDRRRCTASAKCADDDEVVEYTTPEIGKITPKNSPLWKTDPDQQLCYYAGRALCRRHFPDVLLGVHFRDELIDNPRMVENVEYERIENPLGGDDDETTLKNNQKNNSAQEAPGNAAGASEPEPGGSQPANGNSRQEPNAEAGGAKKPASRKRTRPDGGTAAEGHPGGADPGKDTISALESAPLRPDPSAVTFPPPWNRKSSADYVAYARTWIGMMTEKADARSRWDSERSMRNNLANPLTREEQDGLQVMLGKVGQ